jgi:hypothetical protein
MYIEKEDTDLESLSSGRKLCLGLPVPWLRGVENTQQEILVESKAG